MIDQQKLEWKKDADFEVEDILDYVKDAKVQTNLNDKTSLKICIPSMYYNVIILFNKHNLFILYNICFYEHNYYFWL